MRDNGLLKTFRDGGRAFAAFLTIPDLIVAEVMASSGVDALVVDTEHSAMSLGQLHGVLTALYPGDPTVIVRVPANDETAIMQALDLGAEGVLVPDVDSAADCEAMVAAAFYPPKGTRGFGPRRASRLHGDRADYLRRVDDQIAAIAMIESPAAVASITEIVKVPGLSGIVLGLADLAVSMGYLHDLGNPAVDEAARAVGAAAQAAGVPFGVFTGTEAAASTWIERGAQLVTLGADLQYLDAGIAASRAAKQRLISE